MQFPFSYWYDLYGSLNNPTYLIAYWKLDESVTNSQRLNIVSSDYHLDVNGAVDGTPSNVYIDSGKFYTGVKLIPFIDAPVPEDITPRLYYTGISPGLTIGDNDFTLTCWVKPSGEPRLGDGEPGQFDSYGFCNIIIKGNYTDRIEYRLAMTTAYLPAALMAGDPGNNYLAKVSSIGDSALSQNKFNFLCARYTKADQKLDLFYGDPNTPATGQVGATLIQKSANTNGYYEVFSGVDNPFTIGAVGVSYPSADYMYGLVDEVGFWRKSLSNNEISILYNEGKGLPYPFTQRGLESIY